MTEKVKKRIEDINNGIVPEGYKRVGKDIIPDDWEQRKVGELGNIITGSTPSTKEKDNYGGEYLFVSPADIQENRYVENTITTLTEKGFNTGRILKPNSILFVSIGSTIGKVAQIKSFAITNQQINSIEPNDDYDADYVYILMQSMSDKISKLSATQAVPIINKSTFSDVNVFVSTKKEEQQQIGAYFKNLDNLITLHQRKCDELKNLKKAYLTKMFPQKGQKRPEIRFSGFTDDWEQRKFGELYQINNERNKEMIGYDKTFSIATMTYKDEGNGASESSLSNYKVLRIGDVAFEGHANKEFQYGRFVANDVGTGIMSPRFTALRPINDMPVSFWKYYIHYEPIMRWKLVCSTKAGTMMNELVSSDFFNQDILVPSLEEQLKIGEFFNELDTTITLHQRKLEAEKKKKKALMQLVMTGKVRFKV